MHWNEIILSILNFKFLKALLWLWIQLHRFDLIPSLFIIAKFEYIKFQKGNETLFTRSKSVYRFTTECHFEPFQIYCICVNMRVLLVWISLILWGKSKKNFTKDEVEAFYFSRNA